MATHLTQSFTPSNMVPEDIPAQSHHQQHHGATSTQYAQATTAHHFTTQHHGDAVTTGGPHSALVLSALPTTGEGLSSQQSLHGIATSVTVTGVGVGGQSGGGGGANGSGGGPETDLHQVLSGLQQSGDLSSVLQHQPHLVEDLSAIAAGDVSSDPEHLRFQYNMTDTEPVISGGAVGVGGGGSGANRILKKTKPTVYREQDRFLPIHNVSRIMRNAIPKNGKVSKDAKECMQECVSEFVSFITSEASDKCIQEKRKTITGDDILLAMATLGFDNYIEPLKVYLQKYREFTKADKIAATAGVLPSGSTTPRPTMNNGVTNPNQQQQMVPNMGGTITMTTTTPVPIPNSGIPSQRHQPPAALDEPYTSFSGPLS